MDLLSPYWRIDKRPPERPGLWSLARRLTMAGLPVWNTVRAAAPRASEIILLAQVFSGVATTVALLLTTRALGPLLAQGATSERLRAALPTLLLLAVVLLVRMVLDAATLSARAHLVPKVRRAAELELYRTSLDVELESFEDPDFYDQLHRARDRGVLHLEGAAGSLVDALGASFSVAGAAVALCWLHPLLLLILVLALLPEGWSALNAARLQYAGMPATIAFMRKTEMMSHLATQRETAPEIRANQAQDYVLSEYNRCATELQDHLVNLGLAEARSMTLGRTLSGLGLIGTFVALGFMLHFQWLDLAVAGTAIIAIRSTTASLATLVQMAHQLFEKGLYISDYREFIEQSKLRRRPSKSIKAPPRPGRIEFHQIGFQYPGDQGCVALTNVSFTIEEGQTIALAGENGSGKTTLAKLIAGLYRPTSGRITWDGVDLLEMDPDSLADRVVMVQQQPIHWPRSAKDNVRLGRHTRIDPNADALIAAAKGSRALEVIEGLPEGWQTLLSREFKGGQDLSAGQWQRLAVARGLYRDAPVVIWDEPTAPLDAKAEHAVYESLRKLASDRTVILITHRLASIRNADRIFFLDHGMLVEQGDHDELLRMNGRYAELYRLQTQLHGTEER
jgi:ABC-type multidrug transport system fused ATPase/permease subunit